VDHLTSACRLHGRDEEAKCEGSQSQKAQWVLAQARWDPTHALDAAKASAAIVEEAPPRRGRRYAVKQE